MNTDSHPKTATLRVYDPAMCCSTGVCGPSVDPKLAQFSADLNWLKGQGMDVERFNLAQQPGAFAEDARVKEALQERGEACLPLLLLGAQVVSSGIYPTRDQLQSLTGLRSSATTACEPPSCCSPNGGCC
jgi:hypothetical protein